ncbi:6-carboxytetrahydropterin synthase [Candidatus Roizmanbacteria bacterium]|nr:6-carboxytetrahydropterin synthase [Candidatus Roizmanbacteria bacterium]
MVYDFSDLKTLLIEQVHAKCDHAFMFYKKDIIMASFAKKNSSLKFVLVPFIPTVEKIGQWILDVLSKKVDTLSNKKFFLRSVKLWETPTSSAFISRKKA